MLTIFLLSTSFVGVFSGDEDWQIECKVINCDSCESNYVCGECKPGFYLATGACSPCVTVHPACMECADSEVCTRCSYGYYQDEGQCTPCHLTIDGCLDCTDNATCLECQPNYGFVQDENSTECEECQHHSPGCNQCSVMDTINVVENPSFEFPETSDTALYEPNSEVPGWTNAKDSRINILRRSSGVPDGNQFLDLVHNEIGKVYQDIDSLIAGRDYLLSYYYAPRLGNGPGECKVSVQWNGVELELHDRMTTTTEFDWSYHEHTVTAAYGLNRIAFEGLSRGSANRYWGGTIDMVSIRFLKCPGCYDGFYDNSEAEELCSTCSTRLEHCRSWSEEDGSCNLCEPGFYIEDGACVFTHKSSNEWACSQYSEPSYCEFCRQGFQAVNGECFPTIVGCVSYHMDGTCSQCKNSKWLWGGRCWS